MQQIDEPLTPRVARRRARMTVAEVAEKTGINKSTVSRIERGLVRPLHATWIALEACYGVRLKVAGRAKAA